MNKNEEGVEDETLREEGVAWPFDCCTKTKALGFEGVQYSENHCESPMTVAFTSGTTIFSHLQTSRYYNRNGIQGLETN